MLMNAIRAAAIYVICSIFTNNPFIQLLAVIAVMALVFFVQSKDPRVAQDVEEYDPMSAPISEEEAAMLNAGAVLEISDVSEEQVCMYLGKPWPVWIEINGDTTYIYDGPWEGTCESAFQLSEDVIVLDPGVQYKLATTENAHELEEMLIKSL